MPPRKDIAPVYNEQAVVSPCSKCKNRRDQESTDGKPSCPRLVWKTYVSKLPDADSSYAPLLLTGSEGTDQEDALANPVYADDQHHILVWVARLRDNMGAYDLEGRKINPDILDPSFDTDYIVCARQPYAVRENEATYFMHGSYRENDYLEITSTLNQQLVGGIYTKVEGFARKVDFPYFYNRKRVDKDLCPRGT